MMRLRTLAGAMALLATLAGCAPGAPSHLQIERSQQALAQDSRVRHIVLHYTAVDQARAIRTLTGQSVSAHYLITDESRPRILQFVDESRTAWHAGQSHWYGNPAINPTSIGIELVNLGYTRAPDGQRQWHPYSPAQIERTIALIRDIAARHDVSPANIVGHSDIAPQRKVDPGPLFPWRTLAQAGLGRWFDETLAQAHAAQFACAGLPDVGWFQSQLQALGYDVALHGQDDKATRNVLAAFQMHYRPARHDGSADAETAGILSALNDQSPPMRRPLDNDGCDAHRPADGPIKPVGGAAAAPAGDVTPSGGGAATPAGAAIISGGAPQ